MLVPVAYIKPIIIIVLNFKLLYTLFNLDSIIGYDIIITFKITYPLLRDGRIQKLKICYFVYNMTAIFDVFL